MKLQIPVNPALHAAVKAAAARDGRSVANWCRRVLEKEAEVRGPTVPIALPEDQA